jgi:hypothetical protein
MTRTPRNKRVKGYPRMVLTERDREIIRAVHANRFLRRDQVERLFFATTAAANARLLSLFQHHFLDRLYLPVAVGSSQAVYALDREGARLVAHDEHLHLAQVTWKRKHNRVEFFFLEHTVAVAELHVALEVATRSRDDVALIEWKRESFLVREKLRDPEDDERGLIVAPDAFFSLAVPGGSMYFFVEVDLGTETLERFRRKVRAYQEYHRSGRYTDSYDHRYFRVLTIGESAGRLANLIEVASEEGAGKMFLFGLAAHVSTSVFGPVWFYPGSLSPTSLLD